MEENYVAKLKAIHSENVEGSEGTWLPWSRAAEKEGGEDLLKEMVDAGTVTCRRNPKLPAASKIPWPQNQECQHVVESWSKKKGRWRLKAQGVRLETCPSSRNLEMHRLHLSQLPLILGQQAPILLKSKVMKPARLPTTTSRRHTKTKIK